MFSFLDRARRDGGTRRARPRRQPTISQSPAAAAWTHRSKVISHGAYSRDQGALRACKSRQGRHGGAGTRPNARLNRSAAGGRRRHPGHWRLDGRAQRPRRDFPALSGQFPRAHRSSFSTCRRCSRSCWRTPQCPVAHQGPRSPRRARSSTGARVCRAGRSSHDRHPRRHAKALAH